MLVTDTTLASVGASGPPLSRDKEQIRAAQCSAINMIDRNHHRKLRFSQLRHTIMRRIWTQPRIPQLPFTPCCIVRQPPASSLIPTLFFKDRKAKGALIICRFSTFPVKPRTSLEPTGNSEELNDTRPVRDSCEDVGRRNSAKLSKEWQPIDASIGSNPKLVEPTSNRAYVDNVDGGYTDDERFHKESGRRERPQGIKSGSTNQVSNRIKHFSLQN